MIKKIFSLSLILFGLLLLTLGGGLLLSEVPDDFNSYKNKLTQSDVVLLSKEGYTLARIRNTDKKRNREWVNLSEIDKNFIHALITQEDKHFYEHHGVYFPSLFKSIYQTYFENHKRGASTITMQFLKESMALPTKSIFGKSSQIIKAIKLEFSWNKDQILEAYLNTHFFRSELQGLETASLGLFQKHSKYLSQNERLILLELVKRPNVSKMYFINKYGNSIASDLTFYNSYYFPEEENIGSHYLHLVKNKESKLIKSSIIYSVQKKAIDSLKQQLVTLKDRNVHDGAVIAIDNRTGEIIAYIGGAGEDFTSARYVDGANSYRQVGSTLKPFLYARALDRKLITEASWIDDSPVDIVFPNGIYSPKNHDHEFHGLVRVGDALASSLNVPAVKMIQSVGVEDFWNVLKDLKFSKMREPEFYGPSLALGVLDSTLLDLTRAYGELATGKNKIFEEETRKKIIWMLSTNSHRMLSFGMNSILSTSYASAVKTGTSKDMRDNWCIGFTKNYTVGVWVGNFNGTPMQNVLGVTGAAPIFRKVLDELESIDPSRPLIDTKADEEFQQNLLTHKSQSPIIFSKIIYPHSGEIIAVDPSIPAKNQRMPIEYVAVKNHDVKIKFDQSILSENWWVPKKGHHQIEMWEDGVLRDKVEIFVK
jgi:penicillin-binding protein 1C